MPRKGRAIVILDRYTMVQIARYPSVREASQDLSIPQNSIYASLWGGIPVYESYFVYEDEMNRWMPSWKVFFRVRGLKVSERLEELRNGEYE